MVGIVVVDSAVVCAEVVPSVVKYVVDDGTYVWEIVVVKNSVVLVVVIMLVVTETVVCCGLVVVGLLVVATAI